MQLDMVNTIKELVQSIYYNQINDGGDYEKKPNIFNPIYTA